MKLDPKKTLRQQQFIDKWVGNNARGSLEACTGFGKSYVGVMAGRLCNERHADAEIHIVVPSKYLKDKWTVDIIQQDLKKVKVFVVNTYVKEYRECALLILDEIHNYAAHTFRKIFDICKYNWILGLTATMERQDGNHDLLTQRAPILDTISLIEAEKEGFVAKHSIYNLAIGLNEQDQEEYKKIDDTFKSKFKKFNFDFELAMCMGIGHGTRKKIHNSDIMGANGVWRTGAEWRKWYCELMNGDSTDEEDPYHPKTLQKDANLWGWAMRERKKFIYTAETKLNVALDIIHRFPDKKIITFAQEIDFVDKLTEELRKRGIRARAYHSKVGGKKVKRETLDLFNKGRITVLNTAKALDEGFDVKDIDMSIQLSYTSTKRQNIQRAGRTVRYKEGKSAIIVNVYLKGTQEERWLANKQKGQKPAIRIDKVEEIPML
jgi:superfamily II DNA or RNA helicase